MVLKVIITFFKIGLFTIGGGLASIPFLKQYVVDTYGWITNKQLLDFIAISESTPGPIGANLATFIGITQLGLAGSIVATLSLVAPSVIIIIIISHFYHQFKESPWVRAVMGGMRPVVIAIMVSVAISILGDSLITLKDFIVLIGFLIAIFKFKKHPIIYIALSALIGIIIY